MLETLLKPEFILLDLEASSWEQAICKSFEPMVMDGIVTEEYVADVIQGVKTHGPYIVICPHVAIPHARPEFGALKPGIGVAILKEPVKFGSQDNDPVKYLFPLSSRDSTNHLQMLQELVELLSNKETMQSLSKVVSQQQVMEIVREKGELNA